jgi:uncharacterized membrane protein YagU involved in acid resistance
MGNILETVLAGLAGTLVMTLLMSLVHHQGWARADMIRALGSCVTGTYERSILPGLLIHFALGILFAFPYVVVLGGLHMPSAAGIIGLGALIGFVHGFVMSFILVAAVAEKHPVEQFQDAGFEVAAAHVFGHVAYGAAVATVAALLSIDFGFRF